MTASGTVITFRGFAAYEEGRDATRYDLGDAGSRLPQVTEGQELAVHSAEAAGHTTAPPPRYTGMGLVKRLKMGTKCPSTYRQHVHLHDPRPRIRAPARKRFYAQLARILRG